jgi:hypothetical protein
MKKDIIYSLNDLLNEKKFRKMTIRRLTFIIDYNLAYEDYTSLVGKYADGKAKVLKNKWEREKTSLKNS